MYRKSFGFLAMFMLLVSFFIPDTSIAGSSNSASPPPNYKPAASRSMKSVGGKADVLLIQSALPWNSSADTSVLNSLGYTNDVVDMNQVPTTNLGDYQVVLIVNDQNQAFYDYYKQNYSYFETYVKNGGTLVFFACDKGWASGDNTADLPGGVQVGDRFNQYNIVADPTHPIVTRTLTNNASSPLVNSDLYSNYASHNYLVESSLPAGARVILRTNDTDRLPTLATYSLGKGQVVASGLTWEFTYDRYSSPGSMYGFGRALPDVFKYAFSVAGGYKVSDVSIGNIYPEDNWEVNGRPKTFKHPGDLVDIVVSVANSTGATVTDATLELKVPSDAFDDSFVYNGGYSAVVVATRSSAEGANTLIPSNQITVTKGSPDWTITVSGLTINPEYQGKWNDHVFTLKLKTGNLPKEINASANVTVNKVASEVKSLSDYNGKIVTITGGNLIVTNRRAMYSQFASQKNDVSNSLWKTMNKVAADSNAVIYYVDKYDQFIQIFAIDNNPTHDWINYRTNIPYTDATTNKDEGTVNETANLIVSMIKTFIDNSGGLGSKGRNVAIVGDDAIIPFYRVWDPSMTVFNFKTAHKINGITEKDAKFNYLFSDIIYRTYGVNDWGKGNVSKIYVGRIVGKIPGDIGKFLTSSNQNGNYQGNVVKLENSMRDKELDSYVAWAQKNDYTLITDIDGVTLDFNDMNQTNNGATEDDKVHFSDFIKLFTSKDLNNNNVVVSKFDLFRAMVHGSTTGIQSSEKFYHQYFTEGNDNIFSHSNGISNWFGTFAPFFIYDACLVGLTDGTSTTFMNGWASLSTRGMFASTAVTWTPIISDYNDIYTNSLASKSFGESLYEANINQSIKGNKGDFTKFEMNLYGLPWGSLGKKAVNNGNNIRALAASTIRRIRANNMAKNLLIDVSNYYIRNVDGYNIVEIPDHKLSRADSETPVLPYKIYHFDLPLNATVDSVSIFTGNESSLGQLKVPGYIPPPPMPTNDTILSGYADLTRLDGVFPDVQYTYNVEKHSNKQRVAITVYPVKYNIATKEASIYKNINVDVTYSTPDKGFVTSFSADNDTYIQGGTVTTTTKIENTTDVPVIYQVNLELRDYLDALVGSASDTVGVLSSTSGVSNVTISAPTMPGSYKLIAKVSDGTNEIGSSEQMIKVINSLIANIVIPDAVQYGDSMDLKVDVTNLGASTVNAYVDFYIYQGAGVIAKLPQITVSNLLVGETRTIITTWFPAAGLSGTFSANAVVTIDGVANGSETKLVKITAGIPVSLQQGWNLISLPVQPTVNTVESIMNPVYGNYNVVWTMVAGDWKMFDPYNPAFSDLASFDAGQGYWINMKDIGALDIIGASASKTTSLLAGWNLVGYNSTVAQAVTTAVAGISADMESVWGYTNGAWQMYDPANPGFSDLVTMEPGKGYWIKTKQASTWTLP